MTHAKNVASGDKKSSSSPAWDIRSNEWEKSLNTLVCLKKSMNLGKVEHDSQAAICRQPPQRKRECRNQSGTTG
jgi:hypothetical protein